MLHNTLAHFYAFLAAHWQLFTLGLVGITHTCLRQYKDQSGVAIQLGEMISGNAEIDLTDPALPVAANHEYHLAFTQANMQSLMINASGPVTVYTNNPSGSSPQDTIPIGAGQVLIWTLATDLIAKCPFSGNVTAIYVTNAGGGAVSFSIRSIVNQ